jgi:hypothetical protein
MSKGRHVVVVAGKMIARSAAQPGFNYDGWDRNLQAAAWLDWLVIWAWQ